MLSTERPALGLLCCFDNVNAAEIINANIEQVGSEVSQALTKQTWAKCYWSGFKCHQSKWHNTLIFHRYNPYSLNDSGLGYTKHKNTCSWNFEYMFGEFVRTLLGKTRIMFYLSFFTGNSGFYCHAIHDHLIAISFCRCHDNTTVLTCAKFCIYFVANS